MLQSLEQENLAPLPSVCVLEASAYVPAQGAGDTRAFILCCGCATLPVGRSPVKSEPPCAYAGHQQPLRRRRRQENPSSKEAAKSMHRGAAGRGSLQLAPASCLHWPGNRCSVSSQVCASTSASLAHDLWALPPETR